MKKKILLALLILFVIAQFFRIDKTNPPVDPALDFISLEKPAPELEHVLKIACYDCHSNHTAYPWYSNIAPVSFWMKKHIDNGRSELNFSNWGNYPARKKRHKMEESVEMVVDKKSMPLLPYWIAHPEAKLSPEQRKALGDWFAQISENVE